MINVVDRIAGSPFQLETPGWKWYPGIRRAFRALRGLPMTVEGVQSGLNMANTLRCRYPREDIPVAAQLLCGILTARWRENEPPHLMETDDLGCQVLAQVVMDLMPQLQENGCNRGYCITSKFLHFMWLDSFPMYDRWAAETIVAINSVNGVHDYPVCAIRDRAATGYIHIMRFYREHWHGARAGSRTELIARVIRLANHHEAPFSVLDLIDQDLWLHGTQRS